MEPTFIITLSTADFYIVDELSDMLDRCGVKYRVEQGVVTYVVTQDLQLGFMVQEALALLLEQ